MKRKLQRKKQKEVREKMKTNWKKLLAYLYMAVITLVLCYFASKIYKTDDQIWPRERYIIVATMTIAYYLTLVKMYFEKYLSIQKAVALYHFVLIIPLLNMSVILPWQEYLKLS